MIDTYNGFAVIRYPLNYAVVDMTKELRPIVFATKVREKAHRKAKKLGRERQEKK